MVKVTDRHKVVSKWEVMKAVTHPQSLNCTVTVTSIIVQPSTVRKLPRNKIENGS